MARRQKKGATKLIAAVSILCVVGLGAASFVYGQSLGQTIHPAVTVGSIAIGGLSPSEAQKAIDQAIAAYAENGISISVRGATVKPKPYELGLSFETTATVAFAYRVGRNNALETTFGVPALGRQINVPVVATLDQAQFEQYLEALSSWFAGPVKQPRFAFADGAVSIEPGLAGVSVVAKDFSQTLLAQAARLEPSAVTLELAKSEPVATIEELKTLLPKVSEVVNRPLVLTLDGKTFGPQPGEIADWLAPKRGEDGLMLAVDETRLSEYFSPVDQAIRREPKPTFGFLAEHDGVYAYKNSLGISVDVSETKRRLEESLFADGASEIAIATKALTPPIEYAEVSAPRDQGKVIALDVTKQTVFAFEDGRLVFWTRVSTGRGGFATPTGQWKVYNKTPRQVMDGPGYYLPNVKWVMAYTGDYTIHTAYWHNNFGTPMSHGCTNMYEADAKWLYDWAPVGTPVVVYKS